MTEVTQLESEEANERLPILPRIAADTSGGGKPENPFALSIEEQLERMHAANCEAEFGIDPTDLLHLELHPIPWPSGKDQFRIIRLRSGIGTEGVKLTFDANLRRIRQVFGVGRVHVWNQIQSDAQHLRLLIGSPLHMPCAMWDTVDMNMESRGQSIQRVRGHDSLADELFSLLWMFPEYVRAIDHERIPGVLAGGYELNVPGHGDGKWRHVLRIGFDRGTESVEIDAVHVDNPFHSHGTRHVMPKLSG